MEAIDASENMITIGQLYQQLRHGYWLTWVVYDQAMNITGCFITENIATAKGWWLNVVYGGVNDNSVRSILAAWNKLESTAEKWGYVAAKFVSADLRFASIAQRRGYRPRYVEYVKEFK